MHSNVCSRLTTILYSLPKGKGVEDCHENYHPSCRIALTPHYSGTRYHYIFSCLLFELLRYFSKNAFGELKLQVSFLLINENKFIFSNTSYNLHILIYKLYIDTHTHSIERNEQIQCCHNNNPNG